MFFNLSKSDTTYNPKAGWIKFNGKQDVGIMNHFNTERIDKNCTMVLQTQLLDKNEDPIGFNEKSYFVSTPTTKRIFYLTYYLERLDFYSHPILRLQN